MAAALLPWLGEWGAVIVEHHERYDGKGYPAELSGQQISLGARIVAVADAYDVMTAARAYRRPVSRAAACRELVRYAGTQFDAHVVRAMVAANARGFDALRGSSLSSRTSLWSPRVSCRPRRSPESSAPVRSRPAP